MFKRRVNLSYLLFILFMAFSLSACNDSNKESFSSEVVLDKIEITPTDLTVKQHSQQQFTATGSYSDGSTADISSQVQWHSTDNKLSFSATGLATALLIGDTSVTASYGTIISNESLVKVAAVLTSIKIFPEELTTMQSETHQFTARGDYSDGSTMDLTGVVSWTDRDGFVVFDENTKGLARFDQHGSTRVTANYESITSDESYVDINQMVSFTNSAANLITLNQQQYGTLPTITLTKQSETVNEKMSFKFTDVIIEEVTDQTITINNKTPQTVDKLFISYFENSEKKYQVITLDSPLSPYSVGVFSNKIIGGTGLTVIHPMSLFLPQAIFTDGDGTYEYCQTVVGQCYGILTPSQRVIFDVYLTNMHNLFNQAEYPLLSTAFFATECGKYSDCYNHTRNLAYPLYRYYQYASEGHRLSLRTLNNTSGIEGIGGGGEPQLNNGYSTLYGWLSLWGGYVTEGHVNYNPYSPNRYMMIHHEGAHGYGIHHNSGITYGLSEVFTEYLIRSSTQFLPIEERSVVKERKLPAILGVIESKEENTLHIKVFNNPDVAVEGALAVAIDSPNNITGKASYDVATNILTVKLAEKPQSIVYIRLYDTVTRSFQTTIRINKEEWL